MGWDKIEVRYVRLLTPTKKGQEHEEKRTELRCYTKTPEKRRETKRNWPGTVIPFTWQGSKTITCVESVCVYSCPTTQVWIRAAYISIANQIKLTHPDQNTSANSDHTMLKILKCQQICLQERKSRIDKQEFLDASQRDWYCQSRLNLGLTSQPWLQASDESDKKTAWPSL